MVCYGHVAFVCTLCCSILALRQQLSHKLAESARHRNRRLTRIHLTLCQLFLSSLDDHTRTRLSGSKLWCSQFLISICIVRYLSRIRHIERNQNENITCEITSIRAHFLLYILTRKKRVTVRRLIKTDRNGSLRSFNETANYVLLNAHQFSGT